jgi:hypothetical protein
MNILNKTKIFYLSEILTLIKQKWSNLTTLKIRVNPLNPSNLCC